MFKMTETTKGVELTNRKTYEYFGDIETAYDLTISVPGTLIIHGNIKSAGNIRLTSVPIDMNIKQEVIVYGNVECDGVICGNGNISALGGSIIAKNGICLHGKVFCADNLTIGNYCEVEAIKVYGKIHAASPMHCSELRRRSNSGEWFAK